MSTEVNAKGYGGTDSSPAVSVASPTPRAPSFSPAARVKHPSPAASPNEFSPDD